jgi:hypothetical protein
MKISKLKQRLSKERAMTSVSLTMPEDVLEDLRVVALRLGFSNPEALMRAYIGQGLRQDLARLDASPELSNLLESLRKYGVEEQILANAMADVTSK